MTLEPNKTYSLEVSGSELVLIEQALAQLPYISVSKLINSLPSRIVELPITEKES
jgi:hypothetical protein